ncbi:Flp pilus assembly protein CpaB [Ideonella sp. 4Y11]|uniref:Flp pilus assembly protein CpaB n=1 Tax=Ideonella aquatica TaxID=2824119 RepID=A0A940YHP3_9BURK|nr:Flp pilus assembly protein CpaB [Ideonella aquatica]MBQ0960305.1 Flp pilus assembly protein CpaB [Ideonella aquatica]
MRLPRPQINTHWLLLGLAIALGVGAVYLSNDLIHSRLAQLEEESRRGRVMVSVVVAKRDLDRGEPISAEVMAIREVPKEFVHQNAVLPKQFGDFERQRLTLPIKRGEVLLPMHAEGGGQYVFSATLKKGQRAMTVEVDSVNSISGMLKPGDFIDLVYSGRAAAPQGAERDEELTLPLLSKVPVLATDQRVSRRDDGTESSYSTITLEVSPEEADRIIVARAAGRLTALLRNPDDTDPNRTPVMSGASLIGQRPAEAVRRSVEFIVGGQGGGLADVTEAKVSGLAPLLKGWMGPASTPAQALARPRATDSH